MKDEAFHIPQAQAYLDGKWQIWDPKLTTPPGLYLVSWLLNKQAQPLGLGFVVADEGRDLRIVNVLGALCLGKVLLSIVRTQKGIERDRKAGEDNPNREVRHTVVNILLFPVLFFFYALYYTDVLSVLSVMITYMCHLKKLPLLVFVSGLASLSFRQTNIFWVAIYLGALELQRSLPKLPRENQKASLANISRVSWKNGDVFDPSIDNASLNGRLWIRQKVDQLH